MLPTVRKYHISQIKNKLYMVYMIKLIFSFIVISHRNATDLKIVSVCSKKTLYNNDSDESTLRFIICLVGTHIIITGLKASSFVVSVMYYGKTVSKLYSLFCRTEKVKRVASVNANLLIFLRYKCDVQYSSENSMI